MRVDNWINQTYPALRDQQRSSAVRQLNENAAALRPEVREIAPPRVYAANIGMNAAFAAFWSRLWADEHVPDPYRLSGHLATGEALVKIFDGIPDEPASDRRLIEAWAQHLELDGWFIFTPHR
jgi:hypothetical protein